MTEYLHRCVIVRAAWTPLAQQLCAGLSSAGVGMFPVPLSVSGNPPATHYISAGAIGDDFCALLPLTTFDADGVATTRPGQPAVIVALAAEAGVAVTMEQIAALLAAVEVTDEPWQMALTRKGLKCIVSAQLGVGQT